MVIRLLFFFILLVIGSSSSTIARVAASTPKRSSSAARPTSGLCRGIWGPPPSAQPQPSVPPAAANERGLHLTLLPVVPQLVPLVELPPCLWSDLSSEALGGGKGRGSQMSASTPNISRPHFFIRLSITIFLFAFSAWKASGLRGYGGG